MATTTIYARVPDHIKQATDAYATENGLTLASAVSELLDEGLQAKSNGSSITALEERVAEQEAELGRLRHRDAVVTVVAERMQQPVGACPHCGKPVTGRDLLATGYCPACKTSLTNVLAENTKTNKPGLNESDVKGLLGILGVLLAVAFITNQD